MKNNFSKILKETLNSNKISQSELSCYINVSEVTISRYINGTRKPTFDILIKIADVLNVSIDYLVGRNDYTIDTEIKKEQLRIRNELIQSIENGCIKIEHGSVKLFEIIDNNNK